MWWSRNRQRGIDSVTVRVHSVTETANTPFFARSTRRRPPSPRFLGHKEWTNKRAARAPLITFYMISEGVEEVEVGSSGKKLIG